MAMKSSSTCTNDASALPVEANELFEVYLACAAFSAEESYLSNCD